MLVQLQRHMGIRASYLDSERDGGQGQGVLFALSPFFLNFAVSSHSIRVLIV